MQRQGREKKTSRFTHFAIFTKKKNKASNSTKDSSNRERAREKLKNTK